MRALALLLFAAPALAQPAQVQQLADELAHAAAFVHEMANDETSPGYRLSSAENQALDSLRRLERMAARFEADTWSQGGNALSTREDFDRLMRVYARAANQMEALRDYPRVYQAFSRVQQLMDRLAPFYGGYDHWGYRYQGQGYRMGGSDLDFGLHLHR